MNKAKILLIDDSRLSRNLLKKALGDSYSCIEAADGISGLEIYFLEQPDLVILDLTMPGMNGLEVLGQIRTMNPEARVIVGTADVQELSRHEAEDLGAVDFLVKPFDPPAVRSMVEKALTEADDWKTSSFNG